MTVALIVGLAQAHAAGTRAASAGKGQPVWMQAKMEDAGDFTSGPSARETPNTGEEHKYFKIPAAPSGLTAEGFCSHSAIPEFNVNGDTSIRLSRCCGQIKIVVDDRCESVNTFTKYLVRIPNEFDNLCDIGSDALFKNALAMNGGLLALPLPCPLFRNEPIFNLDLPSAEERPPVQDWATVVSETTDPKSNIFLTKDGLHFTNPYPDQKPVHPFVRLPDVSAVSGGADSSSSGSHAEGVVVAGVGLFAIAGGIAYVARRRSDGSVASDGSAEDTETGLLQTSSDHMELEDKLLFEAAS